jgi:superkiller protein 3
MDKTAKSLVLQFLHLAVHVLIDLLEEYDFDILRQYLQLFPEQALARLISTYLAYLGVPLSDKEETATPSASLDDVFSAISVRLLLHPAFAPLDLAKQETESALQSSIFARRVMAEVYLQDQDYQTTITVSEAGLELVSAYRVDTGSDLILYVTFTPQKPDW